MGHSVTEHRELLNYRAAVEWIMEEVSTVPFLSVDLVLGFHARLMHGLSDEAGRLKARANFTMRSNGSRFMFVDPVHVEDELRRWIVRFNEEPSSGIAGVAADLYYAFETIHPFEDGSGRVGRVLLAYWLHWKAQSSFRFLASDRLAHLDVLEAANDGDLRALTGFVQDRIADER